nr:hypothetical protein [uncultured Blautia sp.]
MANNTIFDDVFRTMLEKMPELIIPVINEIFGTEYPLDVSLEQMRNEHQTKNGERITDSYFTIKRKKYHIECQSTDDSEMVIRMVEYDFAISLDDVNKEDGIYRMRFPNSAVIYLRGTEKTSLCMEMVMPDGNTIRYQIPVLCIQKYTKDEIFHKKLLFLLPFYIMRYEKNKKRISEDRTELKRLLEEYMSIERYLEQELLDRGREKAYRDLIELIEKIAEYIFAEEDSVKEGIGDIMGGKVLELQSDKLIKKGREEAREEGIKVLVESYHEDEIPKDKLRIRLIEKFNLTESEAWNYIERYWKE